MEKLNVLEELQLFIKSKYNQLVESEIEYRNKLNEGFSESFNYDFLETPLEKHLFFNNLECDGTPILSYDEREQINNSLQDLLGANCVSLLLKNKISFDYYNRDDWFTHGISDTYLCMLEDEQYYNENLQDLQNDMGFFTHQQYKQGSLKHLIDDCPSIISELNSIIKALEAEKINQSSNFIPNIC
ncbi:hypothetical protein [Sphingobacterium multivorum]|uniref:hypothetical protein n=1 Tax=Sphingobacterium multivorum TaxID=28454 RepID=UPI00289B2B74|nr:hypothetical protein [Sphingobacterium multivorum]